MTIPKAKQNQARRQRLLDSALTLFMEKGYFATPVREIVSRSGLGTGTFYNYFNDKEDILKAMLEEFAEKIITSVSDYYLTERDLYKRFIETKRIMMEVFAANAEMTEVYCRVAGASETIDQCLKEFEDKLIAFWTKNLEYGIRKGAFNNIAVPPVSHAILATEKFLLYKWIVLKAISKEEMIKMVISFHETLANGLVKKAY